MASPRVVVVHRATEYEELLARHGTRGQAAFFLANRGGSLDELERRHEAQAAADEMHRDFLEKSVALTLPVLFETQEGGCALGHSDTYLLVKAPGDGLRGQLRPVRISGADGDRLVGEIV